jgi:ABC-type nitrate/sulfonate/bicarbonate transport system permease component
MSNYDKYGRPWQRSTVNLMRTLFVLSTFVLLWEGASRLYFAESVLLPAPSAVLSALLSNWSRIVFSDLPASLRRVTIGFACGSTLGFAIGVLFLCTTVRFVVSPILELIRAIPPIAWIPLSLLWFGFGDPPAYFLVSLGAFFPVLSSTYLGFGRAETSYSRAARTLGLHGAQIFLHVLLPQALPSILSGLRVGFGVAWMIVITAELVGAQSGLGYMIQISRAQLETELVIGGMAIIGIVGFLLTAALEAVERVLLPWRARGRELTTR